MFGFGLLLVFSLKPKRPKCTPQREEEKKEINTVGHPPLPLLAAPALAPCRSHLT
jgi:hypothetical protein